MPVARYQLPDGRIARFEVPEGTSPEQAQQIGQQYFASMADQPRPAQTESVYDPTDGMSTFEKLAAGAGKAVADLGRGAKQFGAEIGNKMGLIDDSTVQRIGDEIQQARELDAPLMATKAGVAGNIGGNVLALAPAAMVPGANTLVGAGVLGGIHGALQPTIEGESRATNTAVGTAFGAVGQKVGQSVAKHFSNKLQAADAAKVANQARDAVLRQGQQAGYTVTPATTNPSMTNRLLEGLAGKINTQQGASLKNQQVTNNLARRALGITDDTPITKETLQAIRDQAGTAYEAVKRAGTINTDVKYRAALKELAAANQRVAKDFPGLALKQVDELVDSLRVASFDAESGVEAIKQLRANAQINPTIADPGQKAMARAYRKAAEAMEEAMERHLTRTGQQDMVKALRSSRQLIAKTYTVENALNEGTGNVVASKLAKELGKGKPLSGELKLIAKFSQAFPKMTDEVKTSMPGISPLDFFAAGGMSAASGKPAMMAGALVRPGVRGAILSSPYQRLMAAPSYTPRGAVVGDLATNRLGMHELLKLAGPAVAAQD